jgi:exonuclease III
MKIMFWNIRGLGGAGRRGQLMSQHHLEVICLQETIKKNFTDHMLKDLVNGQDFS